MQVNLVAQYSLEKAHVGTLKTWFGYMLVEKFLALSLKTIDLNKHSPLNVNFPMTSFFNIAN